MEYEKQAVETPQLLGRVKWERDREVWRLKRNHDTHASVKKKRKNTSTEILDVDTVIEHIFSQPSSRPLPVPIPLPQMIDILVDFWEADGLYD